jgi:hypothetical protein
MAREILKVPVMKITNYISSLLPMFSKGQVLEDCRVTKSEITTITQPAYDGAVSLLKTWKPKSKDIQNHFALFSRNVKSPGSDNMVVAIQKSFKTIIENLDNIEGRIQATYNEEVAGSGLTYLKANLLQFVEAAAFFSKFARKWLVYFYQLETAAVGETADVSVTPVEAAWINDNFLSFCAAINTVRRQTNEVDKLLADIPDIPVTQDGAAAGIHGDTKIDPFSMRLIPIVLNPVYHVGMFVAEWQANRYKAAQEELKLVQLRKLNLERVSQGRPDAHVQKEIEYMESRCQALNYRLDKMERENA